MERLAYPKSLPQFQKFFPDDAACSKYLEAMRWPEGFVCPSCSHTGEPWRMARSVLDPMLDNLEIH